MNKSILALAVLGTFAGAAAAQSSVTLYGRIDQALTYRDPGSNVRAFGAGSGSQVGKTAWLLEDGGGATGLGQSRWGLRGTEDLGDGLRAYFVLESGFSADTGAGNATKFFDRQSYVGLGSKSFGDVRLGRQETLSRELDLRFADASSENELSIVETVASGRVLFQNFGTRIDNAINYRTPILGGFQLNVLYGFDEKDPNTAEYRGIGGSYVGGPISVGLTYEELNGGKASGSYNQVWTLGANYNFGIATVYGAYQNTTDFGAQVITGTFTPGTDHDAFNIGVKVPYGAWTFKGQYTESKIKPPSGSDLKQEKYGLSAAYSLSKRTTAYAAWTERGGDLEDNFTRKTQVVLGLGHTF
jgi:predicted porin